MQIVIGLRKRNNAMDRLDLIIWMMGGGFSLMLMMWHNLNQRMDKLEYRFSARFDKLDENTT